RPFMKTLGHCRIAFDGGAGFGARRRGFAGRLRIYLRSAFEKLERRPLCPVSYETFKGLLSRCADCSQAGCHFMAAPVTRKIPPNIDVREILLIGHSIPSLAYEMSTSSDFEGSATIQPLANLGFRGL